MFIPFLILASFFYTNEPVVTMRESPDQDSEVVSQSFFSEEVRVNQIKGNWAYIRTSDGYGGWAHFASFIQREDPFTTTLFVSRASAHLYGINDTIYGPKKTLPYGSKLQILSRVDERWSKVALPDGMEGYIQNGDTLDVLALQNKDDLVEFSHQFLDLPYTWGGRSSFGFDCSGFVQFLYKQIGIDLPRDAKDQITDARFKTIEISELEPGDLIFFQKENKKSSHVGVYLGNGNFIHSTAREYKPWLRISTLSDFEWSGHPNAYYPHRQARQFISLLSKPN